MVTYHVQAIFYPTRSEDIAHMVSEGAPVFFLGGRCFELRRVYIDGREEHRVGVLKMIASRVVSARVIYESQALGVLFVEPNEQMEDILFSKKTRALEDANFVS